MNYSQACGKKSGCNGTGFGQYAVGVVTIRVLWAMIREHI